MKSVIRIWMPIPRPTRSSTRGALPAAIRAGKPRTRFKLGPVWDLSQVEPLPGAVGARPARSADPRTARRSLVWTLAPLTELVRELGCTLSFDDHPADRGGSFTPSSRVRPTSAPEIETGRPIHGGSRSQDPEAVTDH